VVVRGGVDELHSTTFFVMTHLAERSLHNSRYEMLQRITDKCEGFDFFCVEGGLGGVSEVVNVTVLENCEVLLPVVHRHRSVINTAKGLDDIF
jgi:hypothetical protein